jgi:hypothetical protein
LRELEHRFPTELAIVGVHSGKYHAERVTERIREAAIRLGNAHAILNDRQFRTWRSYAVNAWPTLAVIDPTGRVLGGHAGEFTADQLTPVVRQLVDAFDRAGQLVRGELPLRLDAPAITPGVLRYPGKVALDGHRIAIADTGHHRVLVGRLTSDGRASHIERVVGTGEPGFTDGADGRLDAPHGMAFDGGALYIADAESHAVRAADLTTGALHTVAGIGRQLRTMEDLRQGAMSSPWDLALADGVLYIAMAGIHQLWSIELATGEGRRHSGTQREDIADGPHQEAALAQPMGIVAAGDRLYFADAESSAVRWADRSPDGAVGTIVGTGLFDFGDRDGVGDDALLQHPQGLAMHRDGRLLVADSYNDALKWVDPATRRVETWVRGLHEPAGAACGARFAYVADTNAHRIATVDYATGEIGELAIEL